MSSPGSAAPASCIFCRLVAGDIPARRVFEDEHCLAFHDLDPKAPVHILVVPKRHASSLVDAADFEDGERLLGHLQRAAVEIARRHGLDATGFRLVVNHGADGGQSVFHLHLHLLGGRALTWPPG